MTVIEANSPTSLADASLVPRGNIQASPSDWRNEILYFLLPDRFSDGREQEQARPLYDKNNYTNHATPDKAQWMTAGKIFQGGTIKGIQSKLDYLKGLGVTTLWVGPVWKQRRKMETYHGYGIQNFLEVDERFGTRQDLRDLVDAAHAKDMYVILDIIYNHTGDNWFYKGDEGAHWSQRGYINPPGRHNFDCWRDKDDGPLAGVPAHPDDAVWPKEFQNIDWYTRAGSINRWDPMDWEDPLNDDCPWRRGDFFALKDLNLSKSEVLSALIKVYCYWIALSDCDGYRIDTVKHLPREASRNFCGAVREYAESIGKDRFLLLGEVTGGAGMAREYLEILGVNIDAALDIGDPSRQMAGIVKYDWTPHAYFKFFNQRDDALGSHRTVGRYHVSILDDHDKVGNEKARFAKPSDITKPSLQVTQAVCVQMATLGIPCIYYGTEQAFDGNVGKHDYGIEPRDDNNKTPFEDRYLREAMFGATFGAFETTGCHFFNPGHPAYLRIADLTKLRRKNDRIGQTLRLGRLYQRSISHDNGYSFPSPPAGGRLIAWSRIHAGLEVLIVMNVDPHNWQKGLVTIDNSLHQPGDILDWFFYSGDDENTYNATTPATKSIVQNQTGRAITEINLPPAGSAILA
ncbi:MAG: hypothetical protein JW860_13420 [Sedimentisphaerales bacterium]|nr:hypothetical protein [Sedimentisphaerales bacterium]